MQNVLVTGGSGFLGKYIVNELQAQFYHIDTLGRSDATLPFDIGSQRPVLPHGYDLVIHAAGKAHMVPKTDAEAKQFYDINTGGTKNICTAFENLGQYPAAFVFISTVAVYGVDEGENIAETHPLNGNTPYAKSKIEAEKYLTDWCSQHNVKLSILRLPLIAGSQPPGNLGAMIKGIQTNRYFNIGDGAARKSVVMASDVAKWIPAIAAKGGTYNLTDGYNPSFAELAKLMAAQLGKSSVATIPNWLALPIAFAGNFLGDKAPINSSKLQKITATLTFDDTKAIQAFGWKPEAVLQHFTIN